MTRVHDIGAGARGSRTAGCYPSGDGHRRGEDAADDIAHREVEAAGGVDAQDHQFRAGLRGVLEGPDYEVGGGWSDRALQIDEPHFLGGGGKQEARQKQPGEPRNRREHRVTSKKNSTAHLAIIRLNFIGAN